MKKILMIDDDEDLRELLGMFFQMEGYEVFHASNGEEGKKQLETLTPDLITLDMMMPVLDGMGFLRWLRQEAKSDLPVIALSGRAKAHTEKTVQELGVSELFYKPCDPENIVSRAKEICG